MLFCDHLSGCHQGEVSDSKFTAVASRQNWRPITWVQHGHPGKWRNLLLGPIKVTILKKYKFDLYPAVVPAKEYDTDIMMRWQVLNQDKR